MNKIRIDALFIVLYNSMFQLVSKHPRPLLVKYFSSKLMYLAPLFKKIFATISLPS